MKRHVFNLSVPDSIYLVVKEHKKHRLPTKSFFLEIFLSEIDKICEGNPKRVAKLLRHMFLNGLKLEVTEQEVVVSVPFSQESTVEIKENKDLKTKVKKIKELYDLS